MSRRLRDKSDRAHHWLLPPFGLSPRCSALIRRPRRTVRRQADPKSIEQSDWFGQLPLVSDTGEAARIDRSTPHQLSCTRSRVKPEAADPKPPIGSLGVHRLPARQADQANVSAFVLETRPRWHPSTTRVRGPVTNLSKGWFRTVELPHISTGKRETGQARRRRGATLGNSELSSLKALEDLALEKVLEERDQPTLEQHVHLARREPVSKLVIGVLSDIVSDDPLPLT
jgi:hypothetical protein